MKLRKIWIAFGCLTTLSAFAQQPPIEFNGIPIGAPAASLARIPHMDCKQSYCTVRPEKILGIACPGGMHDRQACLNAVVEQSAWGGMVPRRYEVALRSGAVDVVTIAFGQVDFHRIVGGLIEKYGSPTSDVIGSVQNRTGATFTDRRVEWVRTDGKIAAHERWASIDESIVRMMSATSVEEEMVKVQTQSKATAKQL